MIDVVYITKAVAFNGYEKNREERRKRASITSAIAVMVVVLRKLLLFLNLLSSLNNLTDASKD